MPPTAIPLLNYATAFAEIAPTLSERQRDILAILCAAPDHELSGGQIARLLSCHHATINLDLAGIAKKLVRAAGVEAPRREDGTARWWYVVATGQYIPDRKRFIWKLRPEIAAEMGNLGLSSLTPLAEELVASDAVVEGASVRVSVNAYERNPVARRRCIEHFGAICSVCGLSFETLYGPLAAGRIQVHHLTPISDSHGNPREVDPFTDLIPVCANCHLVIHLREPPLTPAELKAMIASARTG